MRANPVLPDVLHVDELQILNQLGVADAAGFQALADGHVIADGQDFAGAVALAAGALIHEQLSLPEEVMDPKVWSSATDDLPETPLVELDEEPISDPASLGPSGADLAYPVAGEDAHDSFLVDWHHMSADSLSFDRDHISSDHGSSGKASGTLADTIVLDTADLLDIGVHGFGAPGVYLGHALASAGPAFPGGGDISPIDAAFDAQGGRPGAGGGGSGGGDTGVPTEYFAGSANGADGFDIWIEFKGSSWTLELQSAFKNAADYFVTVITDDIGGGGLYRGKIIDDLYVTAELKTIDGAGGILGQAGPTAVWTSNDLTAAGKMQFDSADATVYLGLGLWDDIVTHEMTHVLGFGSLWNYDSHSLVTSFQYTGINAVNAYNNFFGVDVDFIPVESDGGSGTAGSHWDDQTLVNELMTGYINNDGDPNNTTDNYLSEFSVMSLADLGYKVTYTDYPYDNALVA